MNQEELTKEYEELSKKYDELAFREELYRVAIGLTNYTISIIDIQKHTIEEIHYERSWRGVNSTMENAPESVIALGVIAPEYIEEYRQLFKEVYAGRESGTHIIRTIDNDGNWDWLSINYKTLYDEEHHPTRAVCFSENITRRREAQNMYNQFMKIVEDRSDWSWRINLTKDEVSSTKVSTEAESSGKTYLSFTDLYNAVIKFVLPQYREEIKKLFEREKLIKDFSNGDRVIKFEYQMKHSETADPIWVEGALYLVLNTDTEICGILAIRDIDKEKKAELEKIDMAQYDQLVHVLKHDSFIDCINDEMAKQTPITLFMIDVDSFKEVNDLYGHPFGDEVLKKIAQTIKAHFRKEDYVGRYGGDEFIAAIKGFAGDRDIDNMAKKLIEKVNNLDFGNGFKATLSIGSAKWDTKETIEELVDRADKALYQVKKSGKNNHIMST